MSTIHFIAIFSLTISYCLAATIPIPQAPEKLDTEIHTNGHLATELKNEVGAVFLKSTRSGRQYYPGGGFGNANANANAFAASSANAGGMGYGPYGGGGYGGANANAFASASANAQGGGYGGYYGK